MGLGVLHCSAKYNKVALKVIPFFLLEICSGRKLKDEGASLADYKLESTIRKKN